MGNRILLCGALAALLMITGCGGNSSEEHTPPPVNDPCGINRELCR